ncbi:MFS transporter [Aliiroseovarius zhejiangensis]|uniref:MFS transporter n=1 Tax=Aliiroseovarius zhejiangensis TaxID=1632025 RepID=A0ABQ3J2Y1_9RHOB|nr:MFS transporter [Aliiroseovarius zhejiangensis]GHE99606.1 MFS transporter [Aliiroseovarius zhejiangensis]
MIRALSNRTYATLFTAQVVALLGTGLMTIALGLLAYDLAGDAAGAVLGTAFTIKMVAYVGLSPVLAASLVHLPRKAVLIGADLARAGVALALPFVTEVWQIYALIFVLQTASASFTPIFQATIPDILTDEDDYTQALSLSRLAYDLENLLSPTLAALLLLVISFHGLFAGTVVGFLISAALVARCDLPPFAGTTETRPFSERLTRGSRIYLATPRLRGLLALNLTAAAIGAFVLVNTVVLVRSDYGLGERALGVAMAAFGGGSMLAAILLPRLLGRVRERDVMLPAAIALTSLAFVFAAIIWGRSLPPWWLFLTFWVLIGAFYSAILTPSGRLLRISAHAEDRPAIFAAQFALSHACWMITYPLAGWMGRYAGLTAVLLVLAALGAMGVFAAMRLWPVHGDRVIEHSHPDLPPDHPHMKAHQTHGREHAHVFVIDNEHRAWPTHG